MEELSHKPRNRVRLLLVLVCVLLHVLGGSQPRQPLALHVEMDQIRHEALRPLLREDLVHDALVHLKLIRPRLGICDELRRELDHLETAPRASIIGVDLRLVVTRQVALRLNVELYHLLRSLEEIATGDLL